MSQAQRPLSPHLLIYKPQLTSLLSVTHRGTGLALCIGTIPLLWWLFAAATSDASFNLTLAFWHTWIGRLMLLGWSWSLFYHLCNGIRHMSWDAGWGMEIKTVYRTGWIMLWSSIILTLLAWIAGYAIRGSA